MQSSTYRLGKIGLVGNLIRCHRRYPEEPYRLGKIGLVGNRAAAEGSVENRQSYRLGKIGLVGNRDTWRTNWLPSRLTD